MKKINRKYKGFSLVEMLLTLFLLGVITLLVSTTLNTVIKASNTTNSKNLARNDINNLMETMNRLVSNAELNDIYLYNSKDLRFVTEGADGQIALKDDATDPALITDCYLERDLAEVESGNEIHIKLYGYDMWTCIGYFEDVNGYGYILKSTSYDLENNHQSCFGDSTSVVVPLHSFTMNAVNDDKSGDVFNIAYIEMADGENSMFIIDATLEPLYWPVSDSFPVTRRVSRQITISTQALTWY